jgi:hypothetical protein
MVRIGEKVKEKFVRIKIGSSETGHKGFFAPIKTITVPGFSVEDVYKIIIKELNKRVKK